MLINRKRVKEFALEMAKHRAHKFTRVGRDFFIRCEGNLKEFATKFIACPPKVKPSPES